jgi:hypothetical protein
MTERPKPPPNKASPSRDKPDSTNGQQADPKVIKPPRTPPRPTPR